VSIKEGLGDWVWEGAVTMIIISFGKEVFTPSQYLPIKVGS